MKTLNKISDGVDKVALVGTMIAIIGYIVVMFLQVALRNLAPRHALPWADGVCRYCFIWSAFLGSALCIKRRQHIAITTLTDYLGGNAKRLSMIFNAIIFAILLVITIKVGIRAIEITSRQKSDTLAWLPASYIYASIPIGAAFSVFQLIVTTLNDVINYDGKSEMKRQAEMIEGAER